MMSSLRRQEDTRRLFRRWASCLVLCGVAMLSACKKQNYELQLQPDGGVLVRQLSVWVSRNEADGDEFGEFPEERLRRIVAAYAAEMPATLADKHSFSGRFGPEMPDDIGGNGVYFSWPSLLGTAYLYSEQFRGNDAPNTAIERRQLAVNRVIDVLLLWLETEFADAEDLDLLLQGTDTAIRDDLLNLNAYLWLDDLLPVAGLNEEELIVRFMHYLSQRGYVDLRQIPQLYHAAVNAPEDAGPLLEILLRGLARRFGIAESALLPLSLQAIRDDWQHYADAFDGFIENNEALRGMLRDWAIEDGLEPESSDEILEATFDLVTPFDLVFLEFGGGGSSQLSARLRLNYEPVLTNGTWHEENGVVIWDEWLVPDRDDTLQLPNSIYAMWAKPSVDFQLRHFGAVVQDMEALAEYCIWEAGLSEQHAAEWRGFLESVSSQADLGARIDAFSFTDTGEAPVVPPGDVIDQLLDSFE